MLKKISLTLFTIFSFNAAHASESYSNGGHNYVQFSLYGVNQEDQHFNVRGLFSETLDFDIGLGLGASFGYAFTNGFRTFFTLK